MEFEPNDLFEAAETLEKYKEKYNSNLLKKLSNYPLIREKAENLQRTYQNIEKLLSKYSPKEIITRYLEEEPSNFDFIKKHYGITFIVDRSSFEKIKEIRNVKKGFTTFMSIGDNLTFEDKNSKFEIKEVHSNLRENFAIPFAVIPDSSLVPRIVKHEDSHLFDFAMNTKLYLSPRKNMKSYLKYYLEIVKSQTIACLSEIGSFFILKILERDGDGENVNDKLKKLKGYWITQLEESIDLLKESQEKLNSYFFSHKILSIEEIKKEEISAIESMFNEIEKLIELNKKEIKNALKHLPIPIVRNILRIIDFNQIYEVLPKVYEWYRKNGRFR